MDLSGKTAAITGAAGGFGREFALACAAAGMNLVLGDVDDKGLAATAEAVAALGARVATRRCDVSKAEEVEALAALADERFGGVQVVFNNAGVAAAGPAWMATLDDWKWVLDVNLMGVVHGIRAFVPRMIAKGEPARVVNTASIAGLVSPPGLAVYAASKHAVVALSESLAHDLAMAGAPVGVTVLCPGYVKTGIALSYRNRPKELAEWNPLAPTYGAKIAEVVAASKISAAEVAAATLAAIREGRFYVLTHPESEANVRARLEGIVEGIAPAMPTIG